VTAHTEVGAVIVVEGPADASPRVVTLGLSDDDFVRGAPTV